MQPAGHANLDTTRIYLREAENLSHAFGTVFPPLHVELLTAPKSSRGVSASGADLRALARQNVPVVVGRPGLEPGTYGLKDLVFSSHFVTGHPAPTTLPPLFEKKSIPRR